MLESKEKLLVEVSKMYYCYGTSQKDIAKLIGLSKAYVSQLLDTARKEGIVEIRVKDQYASDLELEETIRQKYNLKETRVFKNNEFRSLEELTGRMAQALGELLGRTVRDGQTLTYSWGKTIFDVTNAIIREMEAFGVEVLPLSGSVNNIQNNIYVSEISTRLASLFHGVPYVIPLPAIVDSALLRTHLYADHSIALLMDKVENADVAVFTVGSPGKHNAIFQNAFITEEDLERLNKKGLAGDLVAHFLDTEGEICSSDLEERTISCPLHKLKEIPVKICVVRDPEKAPALRAVLEKGYVDYLFVDEATLHYMKYYDRSEK